MKILAIPFLLSALLYGQAPGQTQEPVKVTPETTSELQT